jgi:hypothetical protein
MQEPGSCSRRAAQSSINTEWEDPESTGTDELARLDEEVYKQAAAPRANGLNKQEAAPASTQIYDTRITIELGGRSVADQRLRRLRGQSTYHKRSYDWL